MVFASSKVQFSGTGTLLSRPEVLCCMATLTFVSSLYIWSSSRRVGMRDEKDVIIRRLISTCATCVVVHWLFGLNFAQVGLSFRSFFQPLFASFVGIFLTACLFLGPVLLLILDWDPDYDIPSLYSAVTWRNLLLAPLVEEFVFRAEMCALLVFHGYSVTQTIFFAPFFFGLAHLHHFHHNRSIKELLLQLTYTTVFGIYSSFLFLRTGHFAAPFLAHCFCNYMGFPRLDTMWTHPHRKRLILSLILGLVLFSLLLFPMTNPTLHHSIFVTLEESSSFDSTNKTNQT
jgi:prenyl protein peptidase